jgi:hypothetical protein
MAATVEQVELWRCSGCGKWSHAKRRPRYHHRFIVNDEEADVATTARVAGLAVVATVEPSWDGNPDHAGDPGGVWVHCGPFTRWVAQSVESGGS